MNDNATTTTPDGCSFKRIARPTQCQGLPIVAWRCQWDYDDDTVTELYRHDQSLPTDDEHEEQPTEVAALVMATDVAHKIETLRALIANDAHACTFQSLGQYRSALLAALSN